MSANVVAVRVLPMSSNEPSFRGRDLEWVQRVYFLRELPSPRKNGRYHYPTSGLNAEEGTVVLFQYDRRIVASAVFVKSEKFARPEDGYQGALWFDPESIRIFRPVGADVLRAVWPEFRRFGQTKQSLDPRRYPVFEKQLVDVEAPEASRWPGVD